ncbi:MAG TPA: hypothetical protein EYP61_07385 [Candidatus Latescibacteria bacterium]|nr:hypothetical protein [Candidatus Latescibacterota bacterium]
MAVRRKRQASLLGRRNKRVLWIALSTIALGYILLSIPPAEGFLSLTLAPILLVAGYCVLVPLAILLRPDKVGG